MPATTGYGNGRNQIRAHCVIRGSLTNHEEGEDNDKVQYLDLAVFGRDLRRPQCDGTMRPSGSGAAERVSAPSAQQGNREHTSTLRRFSAAHRPHGERLGPTGEPHDARANKAKDVAGGECAAYQDGHSERGTADG
jgi:hypothetical protein